MSKGDRSEEESAPSGLPRLPPGRHGLPREFVTKNQRERLAAGIIAVVAEHGYHETTITQIVEAAGVSRRTFYTYFSSKEECYLDTWDFIAKHIRTAAAEAAADQDEWPDKVRARLGAALETYAANPDLARFMLIAPNRAGNEIAERYRLAMDRTLADITEGLPSGKSGGAPSEAVQNALVGGVVSLVIRKVEAGEGEKLTDLTDELLELVLAPFLGRDEAAKQSRSGT